MVINADCIEHMNTMPSESVDSIVTDPPYHLTSKNGQSKGFMGKEWDGGDKMRPNKTTQEITKQHKTR